MKLLKIFLITLTALLLVVVSLVFVSFSCWANLTSTPLLYWPRLISRAIYSTPPQSLTFLILGQDPREDQIETSQTTDTIILARYSRGRINAISLPRDLWDLNTQTRINRYYWNKIEAKMSPQQLWTSVSSDIYKTTGTKPQKHILITTAGLVDLMKIIGPVEINLPYQFTDDQYPNPMYINNPDPSIPVYITVSFAKGKNIINADNILPFVRSRKGSDDPKEGGTDLGRIQRQQLVIAALASKFFSLSSPQKVLTASRLYKYFHSGMSTTLTDLDLLLLAKSYLSLPSLQFKFCTVPVYPDDPDGVIFHPLSWPLQAWVYLPRDNNYQKLHQFISKCLNP